MEKELDLSRRIKAEKYPDAEFILLAGSLIRGEGTAYSDLDIVVLYKSVPYAYRESFLCESTMVETFVHDPQTLAFFFDEVDLPSGTPSLAQMVAEGLRSPESLANMRYAITNLVDDLRDPRGRNESMGTLAALYTALAEFHFKANRKWIGKDKYVHRLLAKSDPALSDRYHDAFDLAYKNREMRALIALAEEILKPFGGFHFEGYRFDAKPEMRKP